MQWFSEELHLQKCDGHGKTKCLPTKVGETSFIPWNSHLALSLDTNIGLQLKNNKMVYWSESRSLHFQDQSNSCQSAQQNFIPWWKSLYHTHFWEQKYQQSVGHFFLIFLHELIFHRKERKIGWRELLATKNYSLTSRVEFFYLQLITPLASPGIPGITFVTCSLK